VDVSSSLGRFGFEGSELQHPQPSALSMTLTTQTLYQQTMARNRKLDDLPTTTPASGEFGLTLSTTTHDLTDECSVDEEAGVFENEVFSSVKFCESDDGGGDDDYGGSTVDNDETESMLIESIALLSSLSQRTTKSFLQSMPKTTKAAPNIVSNNGESFAGDETEATDWSVITEDSLTLLDINNHISAPTDTTFTSCTIPRPFSTRIYQNTEASVHKRRFENKKEDSTLRSRSLVRSSIECDPLENYSSRHKMLQQLQLLHKRFEKKG
jgi:hypothetical protein